MNNLGSTVKLLDYKQTRASNDFVPHPPTLVSSGWDSIHLELHQQPKFSTLEHQHNMHVIALSVADTPAPGKRSLDGKMQAERRSQGDIAVIPAGIAHSCHWNTSGEFGILAVEPFVLQQVGQDLVDCDRIELIPRFMNDSDPLLQGIFVTLKDELESNKIGSNLLIDNLKTALAIHLLRRYCTTKPKLSIYNDGLSRAQLKQITEYIQENLAQDLKVIELAAIAQISPYHFIRLFRDSIGKTPHQYILQSRIERTKYLLQHSQFSLSSIAAMVGFCDQSHLTKYFKRITGMTPKQFITKN